MAGSTAPSWSALHPGEVDYASDPAQTISSSVGNPAISRAIDPIAGDGACATVSSADQGTGVATYRLPAVTGNGYTLLSTSLTTYALNPNLIYMQTTAMGESLYLALFVWAAVYFAEFVRATKDDPEKARRSLTKCGFMVSAAMAR